MYHKILLLCIMGFLGILVHAQKNNNNHGTITLQHDNDAFVPWRYIDYYYSFGTGIEYVFKTNRFLGLQCLFRNKDTYFFQAQIRSEGRTPSNRIIIPEEIASGKVTFDRPFAGLLYSTLNANYVYQGSVYNFGILIGMMGPSSNADDLQHFIHEHLTDDTKLIAWVLQVPNQFLVNLNASYRNDFEINKWLNAFVFTQARLGNLYIDISPQIGFRVGQLLHSKVNPWIGKGLLNSSLKQALYLRSTFGITLTGFNATAQGNLFDQNYLFAVQDMSRFHKTMAFGIFFRKKKIALGFEYVFNFDEVVKHQDHVYGKFSITYKFH